MGWKTKEQRDAYNQKQYLKNRAEILVKLKERYWKSKKPCPLCGKLIANKSLRCIACTLWERNKTEKQRRAVSKAHKGISWGKFSKEQRERMSERRKGVPKPKTEEYKRKQSESHRGKKNPQWGKQGELAANWRGGKMPEILLLRRSWRYKEWRIKVFERDKYTCQYCGDNQGGNLESDHIKSFTLYPKYRFWVSNGVTLCKKCHRKTPNWGMNGKKMIYDVATYGRRNPKIIEDAKSVG